MNLQFEKMFQVQTFIALPILLSFILNLASCLPLENTENGILANSTQFPYQLALLEMNGKKVKQTCGAVLIASDVALTSAHCFFDSETNTLMKKRYTVLAGTTDWENNHENRIDVANVYIPSAYFENLKTAKPGAYVLDNIAVIKLVEKFTLNPFINTIHLAKADDKNFTVDGVISGYGWNIIDGKAKNSSSKNVVGSCEHKLRYGAVKIFSPETCLDGKYKTVICGKMTRNECTVCSQRFGSPLVYTETDIPRVIGIANGRKKACDDKNTFGLYTAVSPYLSFIKYAMIGIVNCDTEAYELRYTKIDDTKSDVTWVKME